MWVLKMTVTVHFVKKKKTTYYQLAFLSARLLPLWEHFQMGFNDGCSNAISVILNENILLFFLLDSNFKPDNTFDLISLRALFHI